ncbi:MAG: malonate transporter subunit MadM [Saprospiraceae bacterium]|nr:malonate transporter subunit MadM [Saprospiraceae bacterium]
MTELIEEVVGKNGLLVAFLFVGIIMWLSFLISSRLTKSKIPGVAIAVFAGLCLALLGDKKGIADIPLFAGMALMGGAMLRDFSVVATAMGADLEKIKQAGLAGAVSLVVGVTFSFFLGVIIAYFMGYSDVISLTTIGAGACTYIVGPVTGGALGASSEVMAISIATGVVKTLVATVATPLVARFIGLNNPHSAVVFGGLIGTTSGVAAGLASTDPKLVPYGAMTATFYTGLGCLLCPSVFYFLVRSLM